MLPFWRKYANGFGVENTRMTGALFENGREQAKNGLTGISLLAFSIKFLRNPLIIVSSGLSECKFASSEDLTFDGNSASHESLMFINVFERRYSGIKSQPSILVSVQLAPARDIDRQASRLLSLTGLLGEQEIRSGE